MKIAFDAKRAFNNFTGLGNYSRFVIDALSAYDKEDELVLFTPKVADHPEAKQFLSKYQSAVQMPSGSWKNGALSSVWRSRKLLQLADKEKATVFHGLSNELPSGKVSGIKKVVTIHDLIFLRFPDFYPWVDRKIYQKKFKSACEQSDAIVAVSEQTKEDITHFYDVPEEKVKVIYQGVHPIYQQEIKTERYLHVLANQYNIMQPYFLYVGSIEDRKNAKQLVKAFKQVREGVEDDLLLLIVGKKTAYQKEVEATISELDMQHNVRILNQVPFQDLPILYKGALASVYPSTFEGFGIPVLESLSMRTPVVTGNNSSLTEAGGKHALYAEIENVDDLSEKMTQLVVDEQLNESLLNNVEDHLAQFQSSRIARQLHDLYASL